MKISTAESRFNESSKDTKISGFSELEFAAAEVSIQCRAESISACEERRSVR